MENYHFLRGKSTISMAIFNCYFKLPEGSQRANLLSWHFRACGEEFSCNLTAKDFKVSANGLGSNLA